MSSNKIIVGSIVAPINAMYALASGCERYDHAIVVQLEPFVLVSERTDMRWGCTVEAKHFNVIGTASTELLELCMDRL